MSKNWPNNPRGGSFPTNVVELVKVDVNLKRNWKSLRDLLIEMKWWTCFFFHIL